MALYEELNTTEQRKMAMLQDIGIDIIDKAIKNYVLHGGTAIWRCYGGDRFSYDLDFYFDEGSICQKVVNKAKPYRIRVECNDKKKIYAKLYGYNTHIGIQANRKKARGITGTFLKYNGSAITVLVLSPTGIFTEKITAYNDRLESKDLYDLYVLARGDANGGYVIEKARVKEKLNSLLASFRKPVDKWEDLETMLLHGRPPKLNEVISYLSSWVEK